MKPDSITLAVLLSGGGTTLQNIIDHIDAGKLDARVGVVISSKKGAFGLQRAEKHGIDNYVVERKAFDLETFNKKINEILLRYDPDLILLAGFLSLLMPDEKFKGAIMNIHPALIPSFCGKGYYGARVHRAVIESGVKVSGCTVHFVDDEYDHGPIILQAAVPVLDDDTPDSLAERIHHEENRLYPEAVRLFAQGRLRVAGRRVTIGPAQASP
jgi:formyltetrahydrofolate-dependent phosphoribosylglycinamide formyltransferase